MFYFSWIEENEAFSAEKHMQNKEEVSSILLKETEGHPAFLEVVLIGDPLVHKERCFGILSYGTKDNPLILFRGLCSALSKRTGDFLTVRLHLHAFPDEDTLRKETTQELRALLTQKPFYHPLFGPESPDNLLAGQPIVFYWSRVTGKASLSPVCPTKAPINITNCYRGNSLEYVVDKPVTEVHLSVHAEWIQNVYGCFSENSRLYKSFPQEGIFFTSNTISTYTGESLKRSWPKPGPIGTSGYHIVHSTLEEVPPPKKLSLEIGNMAVTRIPSILYLGSRTQKHLKKKGTQEEILCVKRQWFKASLLFAWNMRQKREETITVSIKSAVHSNEGISKTLSCSLDRITAPQEYPFWTVHRPYAKETLVQFCGAVYKAKKDHISALSFTPSHWEESVQDTKKLRASLNGSFFLSAEGYDAFDHALMRAKTILTFGARCVKIHIKGGAKDLAHLTTDDHVCLFDTRLPFGYAEGKVISYTLSASYEQAEVSLIIGCSIGKKKADTTTVLQKEPTYVAEGYCEEDYGGYKNTLRQCEGLSYYRYDNQGPKDAYAHFGFLKNRSLIKSIKVHNPPNVQEIKLQEAYANGQISQEKREKIHDLNTKIYIEFDSIRGTESLTHTIEPVMAGPFFPAEHMRLGEN